jgi:hypothetical protein
MQDFKTNCLRCSQLNELIQSQQAEIESMI